MGVMLLNMLIWFATQLNLILLAPETVTTATLKFFATQLVGSAVLALGLFYVFRYLRAEPNPAPSLPTLRSVISEALSSSLSLRWGILLGLLYALAYLFISGVIVYQPNVDFGQAYGVSGPSWTVAGCCGSFGTVPTIIVFALPQFHLGLQFIPLNLLFAFLIPILVGFNMVFVRFAIMKRPSAGRGRWGASVGAVVGLLTGCPSCAGFFLASTVGGLGATAFAAALTPYQALFIVVSIPVLLITPVLVAGSVQRSMIVACNTALLQS
jgi:hypothetical protein